MTDGEERGRLAIGPLSSGPIDGIGTPMRIKANQLRTVNAIAAIAPDA